MIYSALLDDVIGSMVEARPDCSDVIIDDGRYGEATLALVRNSVGRLVGPLGIASLAMSHTFAGLQLADASPTVFSTAPW